MSNRNKVIKSILISISILLMVILSIIGAYHLLRCLGKEIIQSLKNNIENDRNNQAEYAENYLSDISIDISGYTITLDYTNVEEYTTFEESNGTFTVQDTVINASNNINNSTITINEIEVIIDDNFMNERTEVFNKVNNIWKLYKYNSINQYRQTNEFKLMVWNGNLYIFTKGISYSWSGNWLNQIPIVMYQYDIIQDKVYYLGYLSTQYSPNHHLDALCNGYNERKLSFKFIEQNIEN